jgi:hypothetical protein
MKYPNRIIQKGEADKKIVKALQNKLNDVGCGPVDVDGDFGNQTNAAVKLFQSTRKDANGNPLVIDGKIGAITWEVLFGSDTVSTQQDATSAFLRELIIAAQVEVGTMEVPLGSNKGPRVKQYLNSVGLDEGYYWCAAFVYFCAEKAAAKLGKTNPLVKTAGCIDHWNRTTGKKIATQDAVDNVSLVKTGSIFIISHGNGMGHTGIVTSREGGFINTIEGNSNPNGSSNGIGVFKLQRKIANIQKGFILY